MPQKLKRKLQSNKALSARWEETNLNEHQDSMDEDEDYGNSMELNDCYPEDDCTEKNFKSEWDLHVIGDLFELCKSSCGSRKLSVLVYMILHQVGLSWRNTDAILGNIGAYRVRTAHQWTETFLSGDIEAFYEDGWGGKHSESFYGTFPELKTEAKAFAIESCSRKSADFTVVDLANFVDMKFYELTQKVKVSNVLVRSVESCRLDLRRWGAKFRQNSQRPYFEGHERSGVVAHRREFITHFLQRKDQYYTITDGDQPMWRTSSQKPCVLICILCPARLFEKT